MQTLGKRFGSDGLHIFLIREVDARFDEGERSAQLVDEGAGDAGQLAVGQGVGGGELGVACGGDGCGDALGLHEVQPPGEVSAERELARLGQSRPRREALVQHAVEQRRVPGQLQLGGVVAGVGVGGGEGEEQSGEGGERGGAESHRLSPPQLRSGGLLEDLVEDEEGVGAGEADQAAGGATGGGADRGDGVERGGGVRHPAITASSAASAFGRASGPAPLRHGRRVPFASPRAFP